MLPFLGPETPVYATQTLICFGKKGFLSNSSEFPANSRNQRMLANYKRLASANCRTSTKKQPASSQSIRSQSRAATPDGVLPAFDPAHHNKPVTCAKLCTCL